MSLQQVDTIFKRRKTEGLGAFKHDLPTGTLKNYSNYVVFAGLFAFVLDLIAESDIHAIA